MHESDLNNHLHGTYENKVPKWRLSNISLSSSLPSYAVQLVTCAFLSVPLKTKIIKIPNQFRYTLSISTSTVASINNALHTICVKNLFLLAWFVIHSFYRSQRLQLLCLTSRLNAQLSTCMAGDIVNAKPYGIHVEVHRIRDGGENRKRSTTPVQIGHWNVWPKEDLPEKDKPTPTPLVPSHNNLLWWDWIADRMSCLKWRSEGSGMRYRCIWTVYSLICSH